MRINSSSESLGMGGILNQQTRALQKNYERLSSGKRINHAQDDAAGLAIATSLLATADTRSVGVRNLSDSMSMAEISDGALEQVSDMTTRMAELAMQSANGTLSDDQRKALNGEYQSLRQEIDRISETTEFNGNKLLKSDSSTTIQAGVDGSYSSQLIMTLPGVSAASLGLAENIATQEGAKVALDASKKAVESVAASRGDIGTVVSRVQTAIEGMLSSEVNERAAASRITDADIASESSSLAANKISQQAATAMSAQANIQAGTALKLLAM